MANYEIVMPKMGESVQEATITRWFKKEGDKIEEDDVLLEIATDKVDTEIPSPVAGILTKRLYKENDVIPVGEVIAIVDTEGKIAEKHDTDEEEEASVKKETATLTTGEAEDKAAPEKAETATEVTDKTEDKAAAAKKTEDKAVAAMPGKQESDKKQQKAKRFYSPLVKSIAQKENITIEELDSIAGSGSGGRVNKEDILKYAENRKGIQAAPAGQAAAREDISRFAVPAGPEDKIIEMDRMRKLIAEHMVISKRTSAHVANFIEADVTNLAIWRNKVKDEFLAREKQKLTYMPVFTEITAHALKKFPQINASVDGERIILRKNINIGFAVALPSGNLIVPVIKNVDQKNITGITVELNNLADAARKNKLSPDDIHGGTFTISNFGTFKNLTGTPIINQPQVAILGTGNIEKKPAVLETPAGDVIAIRHKMILSLSYDHRVIDGALAGEFLLEIKNQLEQFDINRSI
jgi:2-oxoglutarate dehydrogenase E2 component (dihydrolipoamide succinyltransferase)